VTPRTLVAGFTSSEVEAIYLERELGQTPVLEHTSLMVALFVLLPFFFRGVVDTRR
jgi:hypothetical protein